MEPQLTFRSSEAANLAGVSLRQLQWWDERGLLKATRNGRPREYSLGQIIALFVMARIHRTVRRRARKGLLKLASSAETTEYVVVSARTGQVMPAKDEETAKILVFDLAIRGVQSTPIDVRPLVLQFVAPRKPMVRAAGR